MKPITFFAKKLYFRVMKQFTYRLLCLALFPVVLAGCNNGASSPAAAADSAKSSADSVANAAVQKNAKYLSQPLVTHIYTADPAAHVFNGRIYIYPSHDTATGVPEDDLGSHFDMRDYHILSMDSIGGKVTDHGVALDIRNIPWAGRQLWAPDAAYANDKFYLYFPVKDKHDVFRIGVATSAKPEGPFKPEKMPVAGSYSIDPCIFKDDNGSYYMFFGGILGGKLHKLTTSPHASPNATPTPH